MIDTPEGLIFRILRRLKTQLIESTDSEIEGLVIGMNGVVLKKEGNTIDFTKNDMVFPYAFAQALNNLKLSEGKKWFDVDYFQLASITERGIDSCLMNGFLMEGYIVKDTHGNEIETWESNFNDSE